MAVREYHELPESRTGGWNRLWQRTYTRVWRVECTSRYDGPATIQAANFLPRPGDYYYVSPTEYDHGSFVENHEYRLESAVAGNAEHAAWLVTVNYAPYEVYNVDPTQWLPRVSYGYKSYERTVETDQQGRVIRNSANDRYETPVTIDDSRDIITVRRNELVATFDRSLPSQYRDTINASPWNGYAARAVKCTGIGTSDEQYDSNARVYYYEVTYVFEVMRIDQYVSPYGWAKYILDQGYQAYDSTGKKGPILVKGQPASDPQLLDSTGKVLAAGGSPKYAVWYVYPEKDFGVFNINLSATLGRV